MNFKNYIFIVTAGIWLLNMMMFSADAKGTIFDSPFDEEQRIFRENLFSETPFQNPFAEGSEIFRESPFDEIPFQFTPFETSAVTFALPEGEDPNIQKLVPVGSSLPLFFFAVVFGVLRFLRKKRNRFT
jgi:hypothetical protein